MDKKALTISIAFIVLIIALLSLLILTKPKGKTIKLPNDQTPGISSSATETQQITTTTITITNTTTNQSLGQDIYNKTVKNPSESIPQTNPFEQKTNPFQNLKTNPF